MIHALTAAQMRSAEERAVAEHGVLLSDLMARAGGAVAHEVARRAPDGEVAVLAGTGNNGGDGWVAARELAALGRRVHVFSRVAPEALSGIAADAARAATAVGVAWTAERTPSADDLSPFACVVDALLGIGLSGPVRDDLEPWVDAVNGAGTLVVSADVPTGVDSDTGAVLGPAVAADVTVTFSAPKIGLVQYPGAGYAGEVVVADVGVPSELLSPSEAPEIWSDAEYAALLPLPAPDAHKNQRGRVLVVAGSGAYPGAAVLAVRGAQRMGAGYVTLAVPATVARVVQSHLVSGVVVGMPENPGHTFASRDADRILDMVSDYDAVVLGPGLTVARGAVTVVRTLVASLPIPLVVDADGLNALVDATELLASREAPTVITPHPGELGRLLCGSAVDVQANRLQAASVLGRGTVSCVLKGAGTVTAGQGRAVINTSGGPALATAGTGDVLAGMIGALLATGRSSLEAGALGAFLHGRAGEAAAELLTPVCVNAEDIPDQIPVAVAELLGAW